MPMDQWHCSSYYRPRQSRVARYRRVSRAQWHILGMTSQWHLRCLSMEAVRVGISRVSFFLDQGVYEFKNCYSKFNSKSCQLIKIRVKGERRPVYGRAHTTSRALPLHAAILPIDTQWGPLTLHLWEMVEL